MPGVWSAFFRLFSQTFVAVCFTLVSLYYVVFLTMSFILGTSSAEVEEEDTRETFSTDLYIFDSDEPPQERIVLIENDAYIEGAPKRYVLSPQLVRKMEKQFMKCEKVSVAFLFFDDVVQCLNHCEKSLEDSFIQYLPISKYVEENEPETWSMRFLECLYLVQNDFLLVSYGLEKFDAEEVFQKTSYVLPDRLILFKICERLTQNEANKLRKSVKGATWEDYLEIFFLKLNRPEQWADVYDYLKSLGNPEISSLMGEFEDKIKLIRMSLKSVLPPLPALHPGVLSELHDVYPIQDPAHVGLCIIINQVSFEDDCLPTRHGSEKDALDLVNVMRTYKFEVLKFNNIDLRFFGRPSDFTPDKADGIPFSRAIDKHFMDNYSVFFLIVMSHGSEGTFYSRDSQPVPINYILELLHSRRKLRKIPKVVIIQACQGEKYLQCTSEHISTDSGDSAGVDAPARNPAISHQILDQIAHHISDAFIVMSTVPGFKSFRDVHTGSYFIQYLCECLRKYPNDSFFDVVTEVIRLVNSKVVGGLLTQQPECRSLLKKKLYLRHFPKVKHENAI